jgi:hypothetical protein
MQKKQTLMAGCGFLLMLLLTACASTKYIPVRYQLAPQSKALEGKQLFLKVTDARTDTRLFNAAAQKEFEDFKGGFALTLAYGDEQGLVAGTYDLTTLFYEALRYKLQNMGIQVLDQLHSGTPIMHVNLKEFLLSLEKNKWMATLSYKVSLSAEPNTVASDTISGSAERVKVMGIGAAEKVLGDIFSDSLNQLDMAALFAKAGL